MGRGGHGCHTKPKHVSSWGQAGSLTETAELWGGKPNLPQGRSPGPSSASKASGATSHPTSPHCHSSSSLPADQALPGTVPAPDPGPCRSLRWACSPDAYVASLIPPSLCSGVTCHDASTAPLPTHFRPPKWPARLASAHLASAHIPCFCFWCFLLCAHSSASSVRVLPTVF